MAKKNHIVDAIELVRDELLGYVVDAEQSMFDHDDGESHSKPEARAKALEFIDAMVEDLEQLKATITKKY